MTMTDSYKYQINLFPSIGINDIKLGSSLYDVLKYLIAQGFQLKFIFDPKKVVEVPYIILIKNLSIRLFFNPASQLLVFIELNKFDNLNLHYKENKINGLNLKKIYNNSFGPTYPGDTNEGNYYLSYPGISFRFLIPTDLLTIDDNNKLLMNLLKKDNLTVQTIVIHSYEDWNDVHNEHIENEQHKFSLFENNSTRITQSKIIKIERLDCIIPQGKIKINFESHPDLIEHYEMTLNKTLQQDILAIIGPPDEIFLKNDSRLTIHGTKRKPTTTSSGHEDHEIFHNYFRYGFDILYDISSNQGSKIKKIILHNNLPNSLYFQKYKKCIWRMIGYESQPKHGGTHNGIHNHGTNTNSSISEELSWDRFSKTEGIATSEMYFNEISSNFKTKTKGTWFTSPIILNRNDLFNSLENSIEFVTIDDEEEDEDKQKDDDDNKTWGQALIYAYKRCIWEVLSVNDGVNSVTLY